MKNLSIYLLFLVALLFTIIKKVQKPEPQKIVPKKSAIKVEIPKKSDLKLLPVEPIEEEKDVVQKIAEIKEVKKVPLSSKKPKKAKEEVQLTIMPDITKEIDDVIAPKPYTPIKKDTSVAKFEEIKTNIHGSYKKTDALVAQDGYLGFSLDEVHKIFGFDIGVSDNIYAGVEVDSVDNNTMEYSYFNLNASIGYRLHENLNIEALYSSLNTVYRSDYFFHIYNADLFGLGINYTLLRRNNYSLDTRISQIMSKDDTKRDIGISVKVPLNKVILDIGYEISNREAQINAEGYSGNLKRKDDSVGFGLIYKF